MTMKALVTIGIATLALGLLAACGSDPTPTPRPTPTSAPVAEPTPTVDPWAALISAAQAEGELVPVTTGG